ncbi:TrbI/VirB10 family protein [Pontixanthobacter aestiaquae]|uniref:Type VI secretion protein n=1 Tax=Pontixanthobacter aestiaquae TaxID=1509367 RepID=A0A844Z6P5_9SPHN|nr:TrbI/VirB10 family protein [Pontixanthobacter aestiaquae]MDN3644681.1 TrbI/VirB10 family protein [Pontixanthobacter aestiaquae]MXO84311.1 type VI secretion protein [Pontixanthobacter aestiaquae]
MALTGKLPGSKDDGDPREQESAEIIDLASRNSFPAVTQRKGASDGLGLAAGVALVAAIGAVTLWGMNSARVAPPEGVGGAQQPAPQPAPQTAVAAAPVAATPAVVPQRIDPAPAPVLANPPMTNAGPVANPYATPTVVFDASGAPVGTVAVPPAAIGEATPNVPGTGSANDFASRVGGVGGGPAQAKAMVNPQTTVTQGTLIPAVLETAIDTNVPGYVRAVVSQDVRSFDGTNVLVPRSSRLIGQYQSGLQNGQKRAYVIWTRLIRPDGASVDIQSPAVGFDGTTGLEGKVKSNFFQRFGSAMLLSVVGGLSAIGTGGASVVLGGGGQAAAAAAQQDSQIGPTIRVRQGEPIRVFTARDLDFSTVMGN